MVTIKVAPTNIDNTIVKFKVTKVELTSDNKYIVDMGVEKKEGSPIESGYAVFKLKTNPKMELGEVYEFQIDKVTDSEANEPHE